MGLQGGHGESTLITAHGDYMVRGKVAEFWAACGGFRGQLGLFT